MSNPFPPPKLFWLPFQHACGCILDWGVDARRAAGWAEQFFPLLAHYPCPMHGSATGVCEPPLQPNEIRYLVAHDVYYRIAGEDQRENAERNRHVTMMGLDATH